MVKVILARKVIMSFRIKDYFDLSENIQCPKNVFQNK